MQNKVKGMLALNIKRYRLISERSRRPKGERVNEKGDVGWSVVLGHRPR